MEKNIRENFRFVSKDTLETIQFSLILLKNGAELGLTPYQIGALMVNPSWEDKLDTIDSDKMTDSLLNSDSVIRRIYEKSSGDESKFSKELGIFLTKYVHELKEKGNLTPQEIVANKALKL